MRGSRRGSSLRGGRRRGLGGCGRRGRRLGRGCRLRRGRRGSGCGLAAALDEREDVLLRHAAAAAGARDRVRVDAVLGGDPRDDGRDEGAAVAGLPVRRPGARRGRRRRCGPAAARLGRCRSRRRRRRPASRARAVPRARQVPRREPRPRARSRRARCRPRPSRPPGRGSGRRRPRRGSAPRCRPCRSRSRAAARRGRSCSPSDLSHFVIVPSETDTPIWGMTTSVCVPVAICSPSTPPALSVPARRPRPAG